MFGLKIIFSSPKYLWKIRQNSIQRQICLFFFFDSHFVTIWKHPIFLDPEKSIKGCRKLNLNHAILCLWPFSSFLSIEIYCLVLPAVCHRVKRNIESESIKQTLVTQPCCWFTMSLRKYQTPPGNQDGPSLGACVLTPCQFPVLIKTVNRVNMFLMNCLSLHVDKDTCGNLFAVTTVTPVAREEGLLFSQIDMLKDPLSLSSLYCDTYVYYVSEKPCGPC